jgi:uncharacterized protein with FMN-binding domain
MKRVLLAAGTTITGLIALLSFKTHSATPSVSRPSASSPTTDPSNPGPTTATGATGATGTSGTSGASGTRTVTGSAASTRYGPVEVQITVTNGTFTSVDAVEYPTSRERDVEINSYAIPQLNQEALAAKSANIDMVSGATYTSTGYIKSLQSALTKAGLA